MELFDAFILSGIFGVVFGRLSFVLFNLDVFKTIGGWCLIAIRPLAVYHY
jgi:hypothetical protein